MSIEQDICPICTSSFKKDEVLMRYVTWGEKRPADKLGHLDCVLFLSQGEKREHPPALLADRIEALEKAHGETVKEFARRLTKLGG